MRKRYLVTAGLLSISLLFSACKSNSTSPADNNTSGSGTSYYPNNDGNSYRYSIVSTDSTGTQTTANRTVVFSGTTVVGSTTYQNEIDSISVGGFVRVSHSLFIKNNTGVSFVMDTAGFSQIIPDSVKQYLSIDQSLKILQFPLTDGSSWTAFSISLKNTTTSFVSVTGYYKGMEQVTLPLTTGSVTKSAAKIEYDFKIAIPDLKNIFVLPTPTVYKAYIWVVDNIGIVQLQGNATILNAFTGNGINFADSTKTVSQSVISYNLK